MLLSTNNDEQRGLSLVVGGYASTAALGGTRKGRAHRLPVERVGDLVFSGLALAQLL
jgi:hypothetical protein